MDCIAEDLLLQFVDGKLAPASAALVTEHIAGCASCRDRITGVDVTHHPGPKIDAFEATLTSLPVAPAIADLATRSPRGAVIGRYVIANVLGQGGMGVVYAAKDPKLDRNVALKVLHPTAGGEASARLQREGRAIARLAHPNVVTVFDVATHDDTVFIAMELVAGGSLDGWLRRERHSWQEVLAVFLQAGAGLVAAHAAGLVHRDFKPANVLVGTDGRARVTDFGLARSESSPDGERTSRRSRTDLIELTGTGSQVGTPAYMPPEQFDGRPTDARGDQFSFAVSLYEGLYGERPFAGDAAEQIYANIIDGAIRPPPANTLVPGWVRQAILPALSPKPEDRYPTLDALLDQLRRDPRVRRRRIALVGAVAVALTGTLAGGYLYSARTRSVLCAGAEDRLAPVWNAGRSQALHQIFLATGKPYAEATWSGVDRGVGNYARDWIAARTDACEATRKRGEQSEEVLDLRMQCLDDRLDELGALATTLTAADATAMAKAVGAVEGLSSIHGCADVAQLTARVRPPRNAVIQAQIERVRARLAHAKALHATGRYADGLKVAHEAVDAARVLGYPPLSAASYLQLGMLQQRTAEVGEAQASVKQAILQAEAGGDDALAVRAWIQLLLRESDGGGFAAAEDAGQHAQALLQKMPRDEALAARLAFALAALRQLQSKYDEAEAHARRALAWLEKPSGREGHRVAQALDLLSKIVSDAGRNAEAKRLGQQALAIDERAIGPDHPEIAFILDGLSQDLMNLGELDEALAATRRALKIREASLPPDHPMLGSTLSNLATTLVELRQFEEAIVVDRRALAIYEKKRGPDHPSVARVYENMSKAFVGVKRYDDAIRYARDSLRIRRKAYGEDHDEVAESLRRLGLAQVAKAQLADALTSFQQALAIDERVLGKDHPTIVDVLIDTADAQARLGHTPAALDALQRALALGERIHSPSATLGATRFALARLVWSTGDHEAARRHAEVARELYATAQASHAERLEVEAWLAGHPATRR